MREVNGVKIIHLVENKNQEIKQHPPQLFLSFCALSRLAVSADSTLSALLTGGNLVDVSDTYASSLHVVYWMTVEGDRHGMQKRRRSLPWGWTMRIRVSAVDWLHGIQELLGGACSEYILAFLLDNWIFPQRETCKKTKRRTVMKLSFNKNKESFAVSPLWICDCTRTKSIHLIHRKQLIKESMSMKADPNSRPTTYYFWQPRLTAMIGLWKSLPKLKTAAPEVDCCWLPVGSWVNGGNDPRHTCVSCLCHV